MKNQGKRAKRKQIRRKRIVKKLVSKGVSAFNKWDATAALATLSPSKAATASEIFKIVESMTKKGPYRKALRGGPSYKTSKSKVVRGRKMTKYGKFAKKFGSCLYDKVDTYRLIGNGGDRLFWDYGGKQTGFWTSLADPSTYPHNGGIRNDSTAINAANSTIHANDVRWYVHYVKIMAKMVNSTPFPIEIEIVDYDYRKRQFEGTAIKPKDVLDNDYAALNFNQTVVAGTWGFEQFPYLPMTRQYCTNFHKEFKVRTRKRTIMPGEVYTHVSFNRINKSFAASDWMQITKGTVGTDNYAYVPGFSQSFFIVARGTPVHDKTTVLPATSVSLSTPILDVVTNYQTKYSMIPWQKKVAPVAYINTCAMTDIVEANQQQTEYAVDKEDNS